MHVWNPTRRRETQWRYKAEPQPPPRPIEKGTAISPFAQVAPFREPAKGTSPATEKVPRPYVEQDSTAQVAADPIMQYMNREQLEKSIARTRKLMQEAARKLNFIEAAQWRDEVLRLEELLKTKV